MIIQSGLTEFFRARDASCPKGKKMEQRKSLTTKVFGPYDTKEELLDAIKPYCEEQVRLGNMTQQEADEIIEKYE